MKQVRVMPGPARVDQSSWEVSRKTPEMRLLGAGTRTGQAEGGPGSSVPPPTLGARVGGRGAAGRGPVGGLGKGGGGGRPAPKFWLRLGPSARLGNAGLPPRNPKLHLSPDMGKSPCVPYPLSAPPMDTASGW